MDVMQVAEDAAKGAAAGSIVPGIGTALGAVGAVAMDLAPGLGSWLFGPSAPKVAPLVAQAVQAVTGTADEATQVAALADPEKAGALRVQLLQIQAAMQAEADRSAEAGWTQHVEELKATLSDVAGARAMANAPPRTPLAWGALLVSAVILALYAAVVMGYAPAMGDADRRLMDTALTLTLGFWLGSSAGSARKDELAGR